MGYILSAEFDKTEYTTGDVAILTVNYDQPSSEIYPIIEWGGHAFSVALPAFRISMAGQMWTMLEWLPGKAVFSTVVPALPTGVNTVSDTVYLDWLGNREIRSVMYQVTQAPVPKVRFGWDNRQVPAMLALYPKTAAYAVYQDINDPFPAWDSSLLNTDPRISIHMHFKNPALLTREAIIAHMQAMPEARKAAIRAGESFYWVSYHHEPEQQTGDDPPDPVWRQRWITWLTDTLPSLPTDLRELFKVGPHYTDYYRRRNADWEARYGVIARDYPVQFIAFSVYDNETEPYRSTGDMFGPMVDCADTYDLDLIVGEYNRNREPEIDPDGAICAQRMLDDATAISDWPEFDSTIKAVFQFHNGGGDLRNRPNEQQAFRSILESHWPFTE